MKNAIKKYYKDIKLICMFILIGAIIYIVFNLIILNEKYWEWRHRHE